MDGTPGLPGSQGAPGLAGIAPPVTIDPVRLQFLSRTYRNPQLCRIKDAEFAHWDRVDFPEPLESREQPESRDPSEPSEEPENRYRTLQFP